MLTTLNLEGNQFQLEGSTALAESIIQCDTLTSLAVSGCRHRDNNRLWHDAFVVSLCSGMKEAKLSNRHIDDGAAVLLVAMLRKCPKLTSLDISANRFGTVGAEAFVSALLDDTRCVLTCVTICGPWQPANDCVADGCTTGNNNQDCVTIDTSATVADFSCSNLDSTSVIILPAMMGSFKWPSLGVLDLSGNSRLGAEGGVALVGALARNDTLRSLTIAPGRAIALSDVQALETLMDADPPPAAEHQAHAAEKEVFEYLNRQAVARRRFILPLANLLPAVDGRSIRRVLEARQACSARGRSL
jgi:hypothetical protein